MYSTIGQIRYGENSASVDLDINIGMYYRRLMPKWLDFQPPAYPTHVSFIRKDQIDPAKKLLYWRKYEQKKVRIWYNNYIRNEGSQYYWLDCWCRKLCEIRQELGLKRTTSFKGDSFHITIANSKNFT